MLLMKPRPLRIIVCSPSDVTLALLKTMLSGFSVDFASSIESIEAHLRTSVLHQPLDFVILDDQSETHADDLARILRSFESSALRDTNIIHLYTPTINSLSGLALFSSSSPSIVKMTKPPRKARLLQTLASLKNVSNGVPSDQTTGATKCVEDSTCSRTLYGNVLVAEGECLSTVCEKILIICPDNPIAQDLLVKQLERYQLKVTATDNGNEAIAGVLFI
jgi:hypothetical protein